MENPFTSHTLSTTPQSPGAPHLSKPPGSQKVKETIPWGWGGTASQGTWRWGLEVWRVDLEGPWKVASLLRLRHIFVNA